MMQSKVGMQQHEHSLCGAKLLHAGKKRHEQVPCNLESESLDEVRFSRGIFHYLFVPFPPTAQRLFKEFISSSFVCQRRSSDLSRLLGKTAGDSLNDAYFHAAVVA